MAEETNNQQPTPVPQPAAPQPAAPQPAAPQQPAVSQQFAAPQTPQPMPQPVYYGPAPLMQLTGGMKFGWLVVGAFLGVAGILVAWLTNADKVDQVRSDAVKFAIIGFVIWIVLGFLMSLMLGGLMAAMIAGIAGSSGYSNYGYGSW